MKKNLVGILAIVLIVFTACVTSKQKTSKLSVDYVMMRRTPCFGHCPYYAIEVYKDGLIRFTGFNNVADSGVYEKKIDPKKAQVLLKEISDYRVDTLQKSYKVLITDFPGIYYNFKYGKISQQVINAHYGPVFLKSLANEIDELVKTNGELKLDNSWKKISNSGKGD